VIAKPDAQKRYASAQKRTLQSSIAGFFHESFPRLFGLEIREMIAQKLIALVEAQMPATEYVRPGQCVWNAVSIETRADSPNLRLIPVVLTLVDNKDIERLSNGEAPCRVAEDATARILNEAYHQGALLSMRDIGLLTWHRGGLISQHRKSWEERNNQVLPHPGSLQDFGSCLTHKTAIVVKAVYEKKDTRRVAQETKHTQQSVDRYLKDFHRVRTCYHENPDTEFICQVTGMSRHLVNQYIDIIHKYEIPA
jgi:hypothetical protein